MPKKFSSLMILETKNSIINFSLMQKTTNLTPFFDVSIGELFFLDKFKNYDDANSKIGLSGVLSSGGYPENEDIIAFDAKDGSAVLLVFYIPYGVLISNFSVNLVSSNNELYLFDLVYDYLDSGHYACYNEVKDELYFGYKPIEEWTDCHSEQIGNDFFAILQNNKIIGWCLRYCSAHLSDSNNKKRDLNNDYRSLLADCFRFYTEENFDKMDMRDMEVKKVLEELRDRSSKLGAFSIVDAVEYWIELNYY